MSKGQGSRDSGSLAQSKSIRGITRNRSKGRDPQRGYNVKGGPMPDLRRASREAYAEGDAEEDAEEFGVRIK